MKNKASVKWEGDLKSGEGFISSASGALNNISYTYGKRFDGTKGINPEELIAAAHAACFTMALTAELEKIKVKAKNIHTIATVSLDKMSDQWDITASHIDVDVVAADIEDEQFQILAEEVKNNCPVSKLLKAEISMRAKLKGETIR